jgi:hypothetical protein
MSMPAQHTFITRLLQLYHRGNSKRGIPLEMPDRVQAQLLCRLGLGPIAFRVYGDELQHTDSAIFSMLHSADITTRVIFSQLEKSTIELLSELQSVGVTATLLKGISTADEFYSPPYLRVMGDVDILIKNAEEDRARITLSRLGYKISDEQWRQYRRVAKHHFPATRHPVTGIMVEVHTGLFSPTETFGLFSPTETSSKEHVFGPENIVQHSAIFDYKGIRAARFTPEFQLLFTIAKWSVDASWAVNLTSINDIVHILRKHESNFEWPTFSEWLVAYPQLFSRVAVLMHYLDTTQIHPTSPQMRESLAATDHNIGARTFRLMLRLLHTYPFNARVKVYDGRRRWRAHAFWSELNRPNNRDIKIPLAGLRVLLRYLLNKKKNLLHRLQITAQTRAARKIEN